MLLNYSALNWATHFRQAGIQREEAIAASARCLCETQSKRYEVWSNVYASNTFEFPQSDTSIIIASYFGLEAVVNLLLKTEKVDIDLKDDSGYTPLSWAARNGHEAVVELLKKAHQSSIA